MKPIEVSALCRADIKLAYDRAVAYDVEDVGEMLLAFAEYITNLEKEVVRLQKELVENSQGFSYKAVTESLQDSLDKIRKL